MIAVVTGASSGIGRATAQALARRGARVVLAARDADTLEEAATECGGLAVPTDVADEEAVVELARVAAERHGAIDLWVNNAAVILYGRFEETPAVAWRRVVETNLFGYVNGARAVLPHFRSRGRGTLVNVSSLWGAVTSPYVSAYSVTKHAIRAFSACLRQELVGTGIHVCTVMPQSVDTPIFRKAGNYTGRRIAPVPPVIEAEAVARTIVRLAARPRREVFVGASAPALAFAHGFAPGIWDLLAPLVMRLAALRGGSAASGPGNLVDPDPSWNRVSGGWRYSSAGAGVGRDAPR